MVDKEDEIGGEEVDASTPDLVVDESDHGEEATAAIPFLSAEDQAAQERAIGARVYELSVEALREQERAVGSLRGGGPPLLAGGLVAGGLLAKPAFQAGHPDDLGEWLAVIAGAAGALVLLLAVVRLLSPRDLAFSLKSQEAYADLFDRGITTQPSADLVLAESIDGRRATNVAAVEGLARWLLVAGLALVVEIGGFAVAAALASSHGHAQAKTPNPAIAAGYQPASSGIAAKAVPVDLQRRKAQRHRQREQTRPSTSR